MKIKVQPIILISLLIIILIIVLMANDASLKRRIEFYIFNRVTIDGLRFNLNPDDKVMTEAMIKQGFWEPTENKIFIQNLKEGDTIIDVGANFGLYSLIGARKVGPDGRVFAFEPDPVSFALLKRNVEENNFNNIIIEQKALSNKPGTLSLYIAPENKGDHRIFFSEGGRETIKVEALRLDDYLSDKQGRVDFIKIDTQGAEGVIFEGMNETINANPNIKMAIEFWPHGLRDSGYSGEKLIDLIQSKGFSFSEIDECYGFLLPITKDTLLIRYTIQNKWHSNLLLTR